MCALSSTDLTKNHENSDDALQEQKPIRIRGAAFWMVIVSNWFCDALSALDLTAISTALPTIVERLNGTDFIWAGSAYALASTAILPMCGGLASIFGRKPVLLVMVSIFALGSIICGTARTMNMLIAGRAVQGFGGGGCMALTEIIFADIVPLPERGRYVGYGTAVWALASAIGPPIGGALANSGAWRWLFYLNLPVCGLAIVFEAIFLKVKTPRDSFRSKITRMDWLGNILVIGSTTSIVLAMTWGGLRFPWVSVQVLLPIFMAVFGFVCYFLVEIYFSKEPMLPWKVIANRTSISGYIGSFLHGIISIVAIYYIPVYLQAVQLASPIGAGVDMFGLAFSVAPFAILCGVLIQVTKIYRAYNFVGWCFSMVGFGILTLLDVNSSRSLYIGVQVLVGIGLGMLWIAPVFAILSPLPFSNNAHALAFFVFTRVLAQSLGIAIGGAIIQNALSKNLPEEFGSLFPAGVQIAYAAIPRIHGLEESLRQQVQVAFNHATRLVWQIMIGISGAGLLSGLLMKDFPMKQDMDEQWGLQPGNDKQITESQEK